MSLVTLPGCLLSLAETELQPVQNENCQCWSGMFLPTYMFSQGQVHASSPGPSLCTSAIFPILRAVLKVERWTAGSVCYAPGLLVLLALPRFLQSPIPEISGSSFCLLFAGWPSLSSSQLSFLFLLECSSFCCEEPGNLSIQ